MGAVRLNDAVTNNGAVGRYHADAIPAGEVHPGAGIRRCARLGQCHTVDGGICGDRELALDDRLTGATGTLPASDALLGTEDRDGVVDCH